MYSVLWYTYELEEYLNCPSCLKQLMLETAFKFVGLESLDKASLASHTHDMSAAGGCDVTATEQGIVRRSMPSVMLRSC